MRPFFSFALAAALTVNASGALPIAVCDRPVELKQKPVSVTLKLGRQRARALAVARDPHRHLMLYIEGISVQGDVAVWEVRVGGVVAGTLSTYGAAEQQGKFSAAVPVGAEALRAVQKGARSLVVTFAPAASAPGTIRFQRLRLVEE